MQEALGTRMPTRILLLCCLEVLLVRVNNLLQRDAHVLREVLTGGVELHYAAACVVLGMPDDLIGGSLKSCASHRAHDAHAQHAQHAQPALQATRLR